MEQPNSSRLRQLFQNLHSLPGPAMQAFVHHLQPDQHRSLFCASRQGLHIIMQGMKQPVTLVLPRELKSSTQQPEQQHQLQLQRTRRIALLLDQLSPSPDLRVRLSHGGPLATEQCAILAPFSTHLTLDRVVSDTVPWRKLTRLKEVQLLQVGQQVAAEVSDAIVKGLLPSLRALKFRSTELSGEAVSQAGRQLTSLDVAQSGVAILRSIGEGSFPHLQHLELADWDNYPGQDVIAGLVQHPTLHSVCIPEIGFKWCESIASEEGDWRGLKCSWQELTVKGVIPFLARLPLASIPVVRIKNELSVSQWRQSSTSRSFDDGWYDAPDDVKEEVGDAILEEQKAELIAAARAGLRQVRTLSLHPDTNGVFTVAVSEPVSVDAAAALLQYVCELLQQPQHRHVGKLCVGLGGVYLTQPPMLTTLKAIPPTVHTLELSGEVNFHQTMPFWAEGSEWVQELRHISCLRLFSTSEVTDRGEKEAAYRNVMWQLPANVTQLHVDAEDEEVAAEQFVRLQKHVRHPLTLTFFNYSMGDDEELGSWHLVPQPKRRVPATMKMGRYGS